MTVASKQENEEKERKENEKGKKEEDAEESGPEANEHMEEVVVREWASGWVITAIGGKELGAMKNKMQNIHTKTWLMGEERRCTTWHLPRLDRFYNHEHSKMKINHIAYFIHKYPIGSDHSLVQIEACIGSKKANIGVL